MAGTELYMKKFKEQIDGIMCIVDLMKRDSKMKRLIRCKEKKSIRKVIL
ncbi:MAG: hypothetical protein ACERKN_17790 [Velocimicrobium sp.]